MIRAIISIIGVLAIVAGFWLMYMAYQSIVILGLVQANAIQATQVYSQASFYGIMAIACFSFAMVATLGSISAQLAEK